MWGTNKSHRSVLFESDISFAIDYKKECADPKRDNLVQGPNQKI